MLAMCADRNRREPRYMRDNSQDHTAAIAYFGNQSPTRESDALGRIVYQTHWWPFAARKTAKQSEPRDVVSASLGSFTYTHLHGEFR